MTRQQALKWLQMDSQERIELVRSEMPTATFIDIDRECITRHNEALEIFQRTVSEVK